MSTEHFTEEEIDKYLKTLPNHGMEEVCINCNRPYGIHSGFFCDVRIEEGKVLYSDTRFYPMSLMLGRNDPNFMFRSKINERATKK